MELLLDYDKPALNGFPTFPDRPGANLPGPSGPVKSSSPAGAEGRPGR